jgi:hypothetical protein
MDTCATMVVCSQSNKTVYAYRYAKSAEFGTFGLFVFVRYPELDEFGNGHQWLDGCQRFIGPCKHPVVVVRKRTTLSLSSKAGLAVLFIEHPLIVKITLERASKNVPASQVLPTLAKRELGFIPTPLETLCIFYQ